MHRKLLDVFKHDIHLNNVLKSPKKKTHRMSVTVMGWLVNID